MFCDRKRLRQWAARVLFVWLFGLAMGVANACALGESAHHADAAATAAHLGAQQHGNEGGEQTKANCLDFCERSSIGALQLKVVDDTFAVLGLALPMGGAIAAMRLPEPAVCRLVVDSSQLRTGPPLRIALQRLSL